MKNNLKLDNIWHRIVFVALFSFYSITPVSADDDFRILNQYACLKQNYRACENLDDARLIVSEITNLDNRHINKLLSMKRHGFEQRGDNFSTFECQTGLIFLARTMQYGLADVKANICAARDIAEFVAINSWKSPASSFSAKDYRSTIGDSIQILDTIYLGDWAAIRSTEGVKAAQCYQSVTQIKEIFSQFNHQVKTSSISREQYQLSDIDKLTFDPRIRTAVSLARTAARGPNGNRYSKRLIERIDLLSPGIKSVGDLNPLLMKKERDALCGSQEAN